MLKEIRISKIIKYFILGLFLVITLVPVYWLILFSFKSNNEIATKSPFVFPESLLLQNYSVAWLKGHVQEYFFNSVLVSVVSLVITLILAFMASYALTRMYWRMKTSVFYLILIGMMIPVHATLIPTFIILRNLGLLKSYFAVILPYTSMGLPLGIFIFSNFLRSIPAEIEEAAFIDGCNIWKVIFQIVMPVLRPAFATVGIFTFLQNWNEFIMAATFIQNLRLKTLPLGLMTFQGEYSAQWGPMGAAIIIAILPVIIVYLIFSEKVEKSFSAGAILK